MGFESGSGLDRVRNGFRVGSGQGGMTKNQTQPETSSGSKNKPKPKPETRKFGFSKTQTGQYGLDIHRIGLNCHL